MALEIIRQPPILNRSVSDSLRFAITTTSAEQPQFSMLYRVLSGGVEIAQKRKQPNERSTIHLNLSRIIDNDLTYSLIPLEFPTSTDTTATKAYTVEFFEESLNADGTIELSSVLQTSNEFTVTKGVQQADGVASGTGIEQPTIISILDPVSRFHQSDRFVVTSWGATAPVHTVITPPQFAGTFTRDVPVGAGTETLQFETYEDRSDRGEIHFCFINPNTGAFEFYTTTLERESTTSINKETFTGSNFDLAETAIRNTEPGTGQVFLGQEKQYNITTGTIHQVSTGWLTEIQASKIQAFLGAKHQYVQQGNTFIPIITMNGYDGFPNRRVQPNVTQRIMYMHANQARTII